MGLATTAVEGVVGHFTTDQAVRAGVVTAAWSAAASYARGLLPRTPVQQALATGVTVAAHYEVGTILWSGIASTVAGSPGSRAGNRALLTAAAVSGVGGKIVETQLRPYCGQNLWLGAAWSEAKLLSVVGLAGGLVTASDVVAHEALGLPRSPRTTLALDLSAGALMAGGTWWRRRRRARRLGVESIQPLTQKKTPSDPKKRALKQAKTASFVGGTVVATSVGLGLLAVGEQAAARAIATQVDALAGEELEEFSDLVGHAVLFGGFVLAGYLGLRVVRGQLERGSAALEPAYEEPPTSPHVSAGPNSAVSFDDVGKEGRRFLVMRLDPSEIETVMRERAVEPVRVVIPRTGSIRSRVQLAVEELSATGGFDKSMICVAAPTGVGYVNYVMAEALEYLTRGDCAIVVPQYAHVPSMLALNKTDEGTRAQREVIEAIRAEVDRRGRGTRVVQFGESLGAQVAVDVGGVQGSAGFARSGLAAGLYVGVPFRSSLWRTYLRDEQAIVGDDRIVIAPSSEELRDVAGRHVVLVHHDDPINKSAYTMVVQRPPWMGPSESRPPEVPREVYFRPITSFVIAVVDVMNGMQMKPGAFRRAGHDYRIDLREALQKTFDLPATPEQAARIEDALRLREQEWAERRLVARTAQTALRNLSKTINAWGRESVNLTIDEAPPETPARPNASARLVEYLNARLGSSKNGENEGGTQPAAD